MSKLNKLVTNYPVSLNEEEVANLSATLAPVVAACGGGGGGGTPIYYYGDDVNINISPARVIRLTDAATAKLNRDIPSKVSDLTDSANYQTVAGMDQYLTELEAQSTYLTKSSADNDYAPLSTTADVEALKAASGDFSEYYKKYETSSKTELETEFANYATTDEVDAIETDLETLSGTVTHDYATIQYVEDRVYDLATKTDLNKKQNKLTYDYDETGAISSIDGTPLAGQGGKTYTAGQYINIDSNDTISVTGVLALDEYAQYEPVLVGDANITAVSSTVDNHTQWNLSINATPVVTNTTLTGENSITAHTTNVSGQWIVGLEQTAHNAIASIDGISTDVGTLKTASASWNEVSSKLGTAQYAVDSAKFLTAISTAATLSGNGTTTALGINTTASMNLTNASAKYATIADQYYDVVEGQNFSIASVINNIIEDFDDYYEKTETSSKTELSTEFAKYVTSSNVSTPDTDYVMTTTGWKVLTLPGGGMTQVIHDTTLTGQGNANDNKLGVAWSALSGNTIDSAKSAGSATSAYWAVKAKDSNDGEWNIGDKIRTFNSYISYIDNVITDFTGDSGINVVYNEGYPQTFQLTQTAYNAITSVSSKLDVPLSSDTSIQDKYLVLRTNANGTVSGWCDFQDQSYSKTEANGTFVATANIDTTTLSGDGKSVSTKLGVKTDVIATRDYVNSSFLPISGGTVSGQLVVSGDGNFDQENLKFIRTNLNGYGRIGLASNGALAVKVDDSNSNTTQINVAANASYNELIQVQHGGTTAYLIPAVTSTTTAGLTNDGILHIIVES